MQFKHECSEENAAKFLDWCKNRGGVAVWRSVNLSNPGASWSTPAFNRDGEFYVPYDKPTWQAEDKPSLVVTNQNEIGVYTAREVKRFHVAVRMGGSGMSLKVTDGGTRRISKEVAKAGEGAYHVFDYGDYNNAVIMKPVRKISLAQWAKENNIE